MVLDQAAHDSFQSAGAINMNPIDWVINVVNPQAGLKRMQHRLAQATIKNSRAYEAASKGRRTEHWKRTKTSAASEVGQSAAELAAAGQELCRNNPLAHRIKMIWASNIVGDGISLEFLMKGKRANTVINETFTDWFESRNCDFYGHYDGYGLQWLWACTIVESGGVLIRRHTNNAMAFPLQLQTIEPRQLDTAKSSIKGKNDIVIRNGVQFNSIGQVEGYWIRDEEGGTGDLSVDSTFYRAGTEVVHLYRKERTGQHLGVSWLTQSATTLDKYATLQDAKIMQSQIAACLGLIVEEANSKIGTGASTNPLVDSMEPGMIEYVPAGTKTHQITPPSHTDNGMFMTEIKNDIAAGVGLSGPQMTGDYSKLNFASGRMSKIEFFQTLDYAQKIMFKTGLDAIVEWFLSTYELKNSVVLKGVKADWTYPPRGVVQPEEELKVNIMKVRSGIMPPSKLAKMYSENFSQVIAQWNIDKQIMGDLPFDFDPSKYSLAGNQLSTNDAASSNTDQKVDDNAAE